MVKNEAINLINENIGTNQLDAANTHWANLSEYGTQEGWWLNIPFDKFSRDLYFILNNKYSEQFFFIKIQEKLVNDPAIVFRKKYNTADIFISVSNRNLLNISDNLIDTQSNSTKHDFSIYEVEIYSYNSQNEGLLFPEEVSSSLTEGSKKTIVVNAYERSSRARKLCIEKYGVSCVVCEFNFKNVYGERGSDFIHVHHLVAISDIGNEYKVDPINDLRPVCPNCHAMLHRKGNISIQMLIDEIKSNESN